MAELGFQPAAELASQPAARDIPAATQLLAIAWLRWRMFANSFRRRSTGPRQVAGLILTIVLRLILWPIFAMMAIGPAAGAGFMAWSAIHGNSHPERLTVLLGGLALLWQFVAVNGVSISAAQGSTFDPASLLRFPLRFGRYLVLRLMLGFLTPSTIIGCLACVAIVIGIGVADSSLVPAALVVLSVYAAMNVFFSRMIGVWLERWLATRRAREIFGVVMAMFFVSFQFLNYGHTGGRHGRAPADTWVMHFMQGTNRFLEWLPPGFASNAILGVGGHPLARLVELVALLACTALFFGAFAARLHKQFLGEYLSEGAPRAVPAASLAHRRTPAAAMPSDAYERAEETAVHLLTPAIAACLRKEFLYIRSNGAMVVSLLTPLIFVFILSRGMFERHPSYLLPGAIGYALMGLMTALYNIFGADGAGVQFYLLAPVRLRDVIIAKNIASLALLLIEAALAWGLVAVISKTPIPLAAQVSTVFWIVFMVFANLTVGTLRSIQAPRKIALAQARRMRPAAQSKTSGLLVLAVLFGCILLQIPVTLLCRYFHNAWLAAVIFAPLAAAAVVVYALLLKDADRLVLANRDRFAEELCGE